MQTGRKAVLSLGAGVLMAVLAAQPAQASFESLAQALNLPSLELKLKGGADTARLYRFLAANEQGIVHLRVTMEIPRSNLKVRRTDNKGEVTEELFEPADTESEMIEYVDGDEVYGAFGEQQGQFIIGAATIGDAYSLRYRNGALGLWNGSTEGLSESSESPENFMLAIPYDSGNDVTYQWSQLPPADGVQDDFKNYVVRLEGCFYVSQEVSGPQYQKIPLSMSETYYNRKCFDNDESGEFCYNPHLLELRPIEGSQLALVLLQRQAQAASPK